MATRDWKKYISLISEVFTCKLLNITFLCSIYLISILLRLFLKMWQFKKCFHSNTQKWRNFQWCFFSERVSPKVSWDTKSILFYCVIKAWQSKISKQINKIYENICKTATIATGMGRKTSVYCKTLMRSAMQISHGTNQCQAL